MRKRKVRKSKMRRTWRRRREDDEEREDGGRGEAEERDRWGGREGKEEAWRRWEWREEEIWRKVEGREGIEWGGGRGEREVEEEEWSVASAEEVESVSFIRILMLSFDRSILFNWEANSYSLLYGNDAIEPVVFSIIFKRIKSNLYNNDKWRIILIMAFILW